MRAPSKSGINAARNLALTAIWLKSAGCQHHLVLYQRLQVWEVILGPRRRAQIMYTNPEEEPARRCLHQCEAHKTSMHYDPKHGKGNQLWQRISACILHLWIT